MLDIQVNILRHPDDLPLTVVMLVNKDQVNIRSAAQHRVVPVQHSAVQISRDDGWVLFGAFGRCIFCNPVEKFSRDAHQAALSAVPDRQAVLFEQVGKLKPDAGFDQIQVAGIFHEI